MEYIFFTGLLCCAGAVLIFPATIRSVSGGHINDLAVNLIVACWLLAGVGVSCMIAAPFVGMRIEAQAAELAAMSPAVDAAAPATEEAVLPEDAQ